MASLSFRWVACGSDIKLATWRFRLEGGGEEGLARTRGVCVAETRRNRGKNEVRPGAWPLGFAFAAHEKTRKGSGGSGGLGGSGSSGGLEGSEVQTW